MTTWKATYISASVHRAGENPIVNECSTTITICDEAAGAFISLTDSEGSTIKLDPDELDMVADVARRMLLNFDDKMPRRPNAVEDANVTTRRSDAFRWHKAARDLLAVIHRDGGHYTERVGFVQSCEEAESIVLELRSDDARGKSNEWTSTKPTKDGVYWVQLDRGLAPETVEVYRLDEDDVWRMRVIGTPTGIIASTIVSCLVSSLKNAIWNGPLSAPELPDNEAEKA